MMRIESSDNQVIVAQATPVGKGSLAIVRASGESVFECVSNFLKLSSGKKILDVEGNRICHARVFDCDRLVDEVMVSVFRNPKSFTGENSVEITCHNNQLIISDLIGLFINFGARLSLPGEFSKRAFLNDKLDLVQAEAICELIQAQNQRSLEMSLRQLQGSLSAFMHDLLEDLLGLVAYFEASFEFAEEDHLDLDLDGVVRERLNFLINKIDVLQSSCNKQHKIRDGIKVVLCGAANAGKSTLFNTLLRRKRAIVSDIPGTTRDTIEAEMDKNGSRWILADTAGLRKSDDAIELEGIDRSLDEIVKADVLLYVVDSSVELLFDQKDLAIDILEKHRDKIVLVFNKIDLLNSASALELKKYVENSVEVSCTTGENISDLEKLIQEKIDLLMESGNSPFLLNARQEKLVLQLAKDLNGLRDLLNSGLVYELIVIHVRDMIKLVGDVTGKTLSDKVLDKVFSSFCIGK